MPSESERATGPDSSSSPAAVKSTTALSATLSSTSFIEKFLLLLLTVLLSGAAVPWINTRLEQAATARQKEVDEARIQRTALVEAQRNLFNEFSQVALTYETLALDVSWYRTADANNQRLYEKAFAKYSERTPELVSQWRVLVSRASVLGSPETARRMTQLLAEIFQEQDTPISRLASKGGDMEKWAAQHEKSVRMLGIANQTVAEIAADMRLTAATAAAPEHSK
jgi:alkylated DNA nucleotide flippase Atl1